MGQPFIVKGEGCKQGKGASDRPPMPIGDLPRRDLTSPRIQCIQRTCSPFRTNRPLRQSRALPPRGVHRRTGSVGSQRWPWPDAIGRRVWHHIHPVCREKFEGERRFVVVSPTAAPLHPHAPPVPWWGSTEPALASATFPRLKASRTLVDETLTSLTRWASNAPRQSRRFSQGLKGRKIASTVVQRTVVADDHATG